MNPRGLVSLLLLILVAVVIAAGLYFYISNQHSSTFTTSVSKSFSCPADSTGYAVKIPGKLANYSVYDGQPSELADLEPTTDSSGTSRWDVSGKGASNEGYYVTCQYGGTYGDKDQTIEFKLPLTSTSCVVSKGNLLCI